MTDRNSLHPLRAGLLTALLCAALTLWGGGWTLSRTRIAASADLPIQNAGVAERAAAPEDAEMTLRTHQGVVCVYQGTLLLYETDIPVDSLPAADRKLLSDGIKVSNELELQCFLEDFGA